MFKLKAISKDGINSALDKAERYRLLNEPSEAASICCDVLEVEPENQRALVVLLLAYTDRLSRGRVAVSKKARDLIPRLESEYDRYYYSGIISEREGKATLNRERPGSEFDAYEWFREAMSDYEKAEERRPSGNEDAILRWNTCARTIMDHKLEARQEDGFVPMLE